MRGQRRDRAPGRRQTRVADATRRITATARNAVEVVRFGGLETGESSSPFDVVTEQPNYKLRHYYADEQPDGATPMLLIPPLMLTTEVWDVSPALVRRHGPARGGHRHLGRRLRASRPRAGRPRADPHRPRPRRERRDRPRRRPHRPGRRPGRLLAGRHVRVPDRGVSARQGHRLAGDLRLAGRLARAAADPAVAGSRVEARDRAHRERADRQARDTRLVQPARLQDADARQVRSGPDQVPAHAARPRRAAAARAPAPLPRARGLDGVERPGRRRHPRAVPRPQPDARGRLRGGRAAGDPRRHQGPDPHRRRLGRHHRPPGLGARDPPRPHRAPRSTS